MVDPRQVAQILRRFGEVRHASSEERLFWIQRFTAVATNELARAVADGMKVHAAIAGRELEDLLKSRPGAGGAVV